MLSSAPVGQVRSAVGLRIHSTLRPGMSETEGTILIRRAAGSGGNTTDMA